MSDQVRNATHAQLMHNQWAAAGSGEIEQDVRPIDEDARWVALPLLSGRFC